MEEDKIDSNLSERGRAEERRLGGPFKDRRFGEREEQVSINGENKRERWRRSLIFTVR